MHQRSSSLLHRGKVLLLILQGLLFVARVQADEYAKPSWSVSLKPLGLRYSVMNPADNTAIGGVAATGETVVVALGHHAHTGEKKIVRRPWEVFLLFYNAKTGKFTSKRGPWSSGTGFKLLPTASGRLLLLLAPFLEANRYTPGAILLLSPSGEELKKLEFGDSEGSARPRGIQSYSSPSGRTVLITFGWNGEVHYQVLNADGLETTASWIEAREEQGPYVIGISDEQMLGTGRDGNHLVKEFKGEWKTLPRPESTWKVARGIAFRSNGPSFWRDRVFVSPAYETKEEFVVPIIQEDGTLLSRHVVQKLPDYNYFGRSAVASPDGQYFAIRLMHENKLTHWWDADVDMDATGADYFLYVWQREAASPIASIKVGRYVAAVSFFPEGISEIAIVDGDKLKVFLLPANPFPGGKSLR